MSKLLTSSLLLLLASTVLPVLPAPALAQEATPDVRVTHGDLNLASRQGIAQLDHRLDQAIDRVCSALSRDTLNRRAAIDTCRQAKRRDVQPQRAQALAASRSGPRVASTR